MDVSVIFATHNREDVLNQVFEAWRKVDKFTEYEYEIICSDDESTDNTVDIIKNVKDLPIKLILNKKGGASKARNAALEIAQGKLVIFTGDDMFPEPDFINRHFQNYLKFGEKIATLGRIEWHPDIQMNYLMHHITDIGCEQFGFVGLPPYQLIDFRHFYTSNISVPMTQLKELEKFFNTDFDKYGFEDIEFGLRLEKNGMRIYYDPDIVITHHHIYNSVEKFCNRHETAGEELVVFHRMHPEIEDRCIYDIEDIERVWNVFAKSYKTRRSLQGAILGLELKLAKKLTKFIERLVKWDKPSNMTRIESMLYAGIFKFYFLYGCINRITDGTGVTKSRKMQFTYKYMRKSFSQMYWDTGHGFNEEESRKWCCWNNEEMTIIKAIPKGTKQIRFTPIKKRCKSELIDLHIDKYDGKTVVPPMTWHNARKTDWVKFDFTNTNDPQIVIENINEDYKDISITVKVEDMGRNGLINFFKKCARNIKHRLTVESVKRKDISIEYEKGQPRNIQICIGGLPFERRKNLIAQYTEKVKIFGDSIIFSDIEQKRNGYVTYLYCPEKEPLESVQILQVAYTLLNTPYDFIVVSKTYDEFPIIGCKQIEDVLLVSELVAGNGVMNLSNSVGRFMRLPGFTVENNTVDFGDFDSNIEIRDQYYLCGSKTIIPTFRQSLRYFSFSKTKPVIFVNPIFWAVGGVERNTIEIMRALKDEYTFCALSMERHIKEQGSLHYQLSGICDYIFDLREITDFDHFLGCLSELNMIFNPDVLWMCNNSPWFETNTENIRRIFENVAMIAQDVYDTRVGWIEYYGNKELKLYDRYIAITEIIKDTFVNRYNIPEQKIDVIYPVIDDKKIQNELRKNTDRNELRKKYGMDEGKFLFSFAGRLTDQKDPLRFLKLVEEVKSHDIRNVHFIMVGDGILRDKIQSVIESNELEEFVTCIPYIENMPEFFSMIDGLILTSVYEGMPIVSIEAMCMSIPVMSTDVGDLKRFIDRYGNGLILDTDRSDYDNFGNFFANLQEYKKKASESAKTVLEFFSAENVSDLYRECFSKGMKSFE